MKQRKILYAVQEPQLIS